MSENAFSSSSRLTRPTCKTTASRPKFAVRPVLVGVPVLSACLKGEMFCKLTRIGQIKLDMEQTNLKLRPVRNRMVHMAF